MRAIEERTTSHRSLHAARTHRTTAGNPARSATTPTSRSRTEPSAGAAHREQRSSTTIVARAHPSPSVFRGHHERPFARAPGPVLAQAYYFVEGDSDSDDGANTSSGGKTDAANLNPAAGPAVNAAVGAAASSTRRQRRGARGPAPIPMRR